MPSLIVDRLVDVGPAAPATASRLGVVTLDETGKIFIARLGPLSKRNQDAETPLTPLPDRFQPAPLARGPAVGRDEVYWIAGSSLLRRNIATGLTSEPELLASDARAATRVAVPIRLPGSGAAEARAVAYIARRIDDPERKDGTLIAKLWTGKHPPVTLTPDGSAANSIILLNSAAGLTAVSLEARTGMTQVHRRSVQIDDEGSVTLGPDAVAWIGGTSQPFTELIGGVSPSGSGLGLLAMELDATRFGLIELRFPETSDAAGELRTTPYQNGLDPAPVASGEVCGTRIMARVVPESAEPGALQRLELAPLDGDGSSGVEVIARARIFFDVSTAPAPARAMLVSYVADRRIWAVTLRCPPP